jgi:prevent-host-death family protein
MFKAFRLDLVHLLVHTLAMKTVNMHEAKTHLSRLVERAVSGERIVIAKAGEPVAVLSAFVKQSRKRKPGFDKGKIWVSKDFDAPLPRDVQAAFEGRK